MGQKPRVFKCLDAALLRNELGDVLCRGSGGRISGFAPFLGERAFAHGLGLARDAELNAVGTKHDPDDDNGLFALGRGRHTHRSLHLIDIGLERVRGFQPALFKLPAERGWEVINFATAGAFEETLLCLPERAAELSKVRERFGDAVGEYQEQLE